MEKFALGQRWISEMEPELGLGTITSVENRRVQIAFPGSDIERLYSTDSAPVKRVRFRPGDEIKSRDKQKIRVETVKEIEGLLIYCGDGFEIFESDLSDTISFSNPRERIFKGFTDHPSLFDLRYEVNRFRAEMKSSSVRGFTGGRIDLIPHQLYIAEEVATRYAPRVLLSDEVGLGKTIEACLIIHRLLVCERISRVLIIVPESLVHQWFVELLRRFNLLFRIFNEEHCTTVEKQDPGMNPFTNDQLGLCSTAFLNGEKRKNQILDAGWDMVVVDEAHHLVDDTPEYRFVYSLGRKTKGLILLTATPEQLGARSHFSQLRLIDPARYHSYESFQDIHLRYQEVARAVDLLFISKDMDDDRVDTALKDVASGSYETLERFRGLYKGKPQDQKLLLDEVLDIHGTGRCVFRNTRSAIKGFPKRHVHLYPLEATAGDIANANLELMDDLSGNVQASYDFSGDPRIVFIAELFKQLKGEKVLLICRTREKSLAVEAALRKTVNTTIALFNETMTLIQRDRSAAWFSEQDGAQVLVCSEIGSEGRNFQFASHLVMFDLPLNPELVEQRIGRLDRIGQLNPIQIHVPYICGSACETLVRWHDSGLNVFRTNGKGLHQLYKKFGQRVVQCITKEIRGGIIEDSEQVDLIDKTNGYRKELEVLYDEGRDRLLELNSYRPESAKLLVDEIRDVDHNRETDRIMMKLFAHFGIQTEEVKGRTHRLYFNACSNPEFPVPVLRKSGMVATFDRCVASTREDVEFLSRDNPVVTGSVDLFLGTEQGNCSIAVWHGAGHQGLLLETIYIPECVAPAGHHIHRFLKESPIRIVTDHTGEDVTDMYPDDTLNRSLQELPGSWLIENKRVSNDLIPEMIKVAGKRADEILYNAILSGASYVKSELDGEIRRLKTLQKLNPDIRDDEIEHRVSEREELLTYISDTRVRLDALRVILMT